MTEVPDFSEYDLEYAELTGIEWLERERRLTLRLRCPVAGWPVRETLLKVARAAGLRSLARGRCVLYSLSLTFHGVSDLVETLLSRGHEIAGGDPSDRSWLASFVFEVEELRAETLADGASRFRLRAEDLSLEFTYTSFTHSRECLDEADDTEKTI